MKIVSFVFIALFCSICSKNNETKDNDVNLSHTIKYLNYSQFLEERDFLFTGTNNDLVYGIEFIRIDSSKISYSFDVLKNWKKVKQIKGIAILENNGSKGNEFKIYDSKHINKPAFKFVDNTKKCRIEVHISKDLELTSTYARVFQICNSKTEEMSPILFYK